MRNPRNDTLGYPTDGDGGASPERRCILTGESAARDDLLRLAISPDGDVLPDAMARAPGRGAWIGVGREQLQAAIDDGRLKGALARSFKTGGLKIPPNLPEMIEMALEKSFLQRLGLEMRSGRLILGSDRIANEARMGKVAALYHAADASDDGSRKLDQAWRVGRDAEGSGEKGVTLPLDREALSVALGRDNVVHLALTDAKSAERVRAPLVRLQTFLGTGQPAADGERAEDDADVPSGASEEEF